MADHEKTYGICENKCRVEVYSKENADDQFAGKNDLDLYAAKNHATSQPTYGLGNRSQYGHTKVTDDFTMTAYVDGYALSAYAGYLLQRQITALQRENADTGWKNLTLSSGVIAASTGAGTPQYRKIGNHVFVRGSVSYDVSASDSKTIATLPTGFRPNKVPYDITACANNRLGQKHINSSGGVVVDYVVNVADGSRYSGTIDWLDISMDFFVD